MAERWHGEDSEGSWWVEIESDRFTTVDPFVVSLHCEAKDETGSEEALVTPSAEQAREMAAALLKAADNVDFNNARDDVVLADSQEPSDG